MSAIREIILEKEAGFSRYVMIVKNGHEPKLKPLSRVNLFVGANNSGKSRFMRELAKIKKLRFQPNARVHEFKTLRDSFYESLKAIYAAHGVAEINSGIPKLEKIPSQDCATEGEEFLWPVIDVMQGLLQTKSEQVHYSYRGGYDPATVLNKAQNLAIDLSPRMKALVENVPRRYEFKRLYIPVLRGLRRLPNHVDPYGERTRTDYFSDSQQVEVFTGLTLYEDIKKLLLGTLEDREIVSDFQTFLSEAFFHGNPVALIPRHDSQDLHVKIGQETEYPISSLGDGIQSIIALTFPLFRARGQSLLIFIEEPEMFLHPGLQRLFLNVLLTTEGFSNFQYFIATHSNHFVGVKVFL